MMIIKYLILISIFSFSSYAGIIISKKYQERVEELKQMKSALSIFMAKIKLTYEPIPQIFNEIGNSSNSNINNIFKIASNNMNETSAGNAWKNALKVRKYKFKK